MAINLSNEKIAEFKAAFELFDKDRTGQIQTKELGTIMRNLGQNPNKLTLTKMINDVDMDGSGTIDFSEFLGLMIISMKDADSKEELIEAFVAFDKKGNEYITSYELRDVLNHLGEDLIPEDVEDLMKEADVDGDGQEDFNEFIKMMMNK